MVPVIAQTIIDPFHRFFQRESSGGIVLFVAAILALVLANSPLQTLYFQLWSTTFTIGFKPYALALPLHIWINDGLMAVFFFLVGLEIKRQFLVGELSQPKQALLPILAAAGGMIVPAIVYISLNLPGSHFHNGWALPTVTDIAFSLGVLALLGNRIPLFFKIFLTALAIVDDIGAILVIAVFYSQGFQIFNLLLACLITVGLIIMNRLSIRWLGAYILGGLTLWYVLLDSGVHATIAGVILAACIPASSSIKAKVFYKDGLAIFEDFPNTGGKGKYAILTEEDYQTRVQNMEILCEKAQAPLQRLEHMLHPWVTFCIMPLFALANAGIALKGVDLSSLYRHPVSLGVLLGLVIGKPFGITLLAWIAHRLKLVALPQDTSWLGFWGIACLGGIGFTMSLFIGDLAFKQPTLDIAKLAIFAASCLSGILGFCLLSYTYQSLKTNQAVE